MRNRYLAVAATLAAIVVTGCHVFNPGGGCPPVYPIELVYPASGSVRVNTDVGIVVVQGAFKYNDGASINIIAPSGAMLTGQMVAPPPSPLPSPLATPSDVSGDPLTAVALPTLQPHATYAVNLQQQIGVDTGCVAIGKTVGYFTTK